MFWLESSTNITHGGGYWSLTHALWAPSCPAKPYSPHQPLLRVQAKDRILHLVYHQNKLAIIGCSMAQEGRFVTLKHPPEVGIWKSDAYYYIPLINYYPFFKPIDIYSIYKKI